MDKILVIDDSDLVSRLLSEFLTSHGFEVALAADANQGYEKAIEFMPNLILLDVQLPDVTGFELCRVLKNRPELQHIPIIMVTGTAHRTEEKVRGFQTGADDYVLKPFEMPELLERIRAILKRYNQRRPEIAAPTAHSPLGAPAPASVAASAEKQAPPLTWTISQLMFNPLGGAGDRPIPAVARPYLGLMMGFLLAGLAVSAGSSVRPAPAALSAFMVWGVLVSVVVMASTVMGIKLGWKSGARLVCLAGLPMLIKLAGGLLVSLWTSLPPTYFTASPALFFDHGSIYLERLDLFELWSAWLLWLMLRHRTGSNPRKAGVITLLAWLAGVVLAAGLAKLGAPSA